MERTRCDPKAKPHGKRPPSVQRWRRKQTIPKSGEHYAPLRDAWTTLATRCEPFDFPDVTEPRPRLGHKFKTLVSLSHS